MKRKKNTIIIIISILCLTSILSNWQEKGNRDDGLKYERLRLLIEEQTLSESIELIKVKLVDDLELSDFLIRCLFNKIEVDYDLEFCFISAAGLLADIEQLYSSSELSLENREIYRTKVRKNLLCLIYKIEFLYREDKVGTENDLCPEDCYEGINEIYFQLKEELNE